MILGVSGKKQSGKDSICKIIQALDIYTEDYGTPIDFVKECLLTARLDELELFRDITSRWEKHSFAEKMKECAAIILNCSVESFEQENFKNQVIPWITEDVQTLTADGFGEFNAVPITVRKFLQKFGTEVGRSIDNDLWVKALFQDYVINQYPEYATTDDGRRIAIGMNTIEPNWIIPDVRFWNEAEAIRKRKGILIRVERDTYLSDAHSSETGLDTYSNFNYIIHNNGNWDYFINQVIDIVKKEGLV